MHQHAEAIIGMQFGDEGKGKVSRRRAEILTHISRRNHGILKCVVVRYSGANNTGATADGLVFKIVPVGVGLEGVGNLIGPEVLVMPWSMNSMVDGRTIERVGLREEVERLREAGVNIGAHNLAIDSACSLTLPLYTKLEGLNERQGSVTRVGSTGSGVSWSQMMKFGRVSIRVAHCFNAALLASALDRLHAFCTVQLRNYGSDIDDVRNLSGQLLEWGAWVQENLNVVHGGFFMENEWNHGANLLYEGSQAVLLDLELGGVPYVTSGFVATPELAGFTPSNKQIERIGVMKGAYMTRVGEGPFPTEFTDAKLGRRFRDAGGERGASTGRDRRCGWLDLVLAGYVAQVGNIHGLCLTKMDIVDDDVLGDAELQAACGYRDRNGTEIRALVYADMLRLGEFTPEYMTIPRIRDSFFGMNEASQLSQSAHEYIQWIEREIGKPVRYLSTGPKSHHFVALHF